MNIIRHCANLTACFLAVLLLASAPLHAEDLPWKDVQDDRSYIPDGGDGPKDITPDGPDYDPQPKRYDGPDAKRYEGQRYDGQQYEGRRYDDRPVTDQQYSSNEIVGAGQKFFGSVSVGLAKVVEHAFKSEGRPNGYILGEEASGAIIAGLRYGEGTLYTKDGPPRKVYWQGPSFGYDLGATGSKTMILVYNLYSQRDIYRTFGGVAGSAYFIGGVGLTVLKRDHIRLAPIVSGVGIRIGANIGYLKFTRQPTWNPF